MFSQFTLQDEFYGLAIQSDGKIVAAGDGSVAGNSIGELARYNTDGTLDTTFGGGSGVVQGPGQGSEYFAVAIQTNGQIVAAGVAPNFETLVSRYNADGSPDTTYGSGGSTETAVGQASQYNAVAIQPSDGEAVAAGFTSRWPATNFLAARYTASASLPSSPVSAVPAGSQATPFGSAAGAIAPALIPEAFYSPDVWEVSRPLNKRRGPH